MSNNITLIGQNSGIVIDNVYGVELYVKSSMDYIRLVCLYAPKLSDISTTRFYSNQEIEYQNTFEFILTPTTGAGAAPNASEMTYDELFNPIDSENTFFGSEVYIRQDSNLHVYLVNNGYSYINTQKPYLYIGKLYPVSSTDLRISINTYSMKDYVIDAIPEHERTNNLREFMGVSFDQLYSQVYQKIRGLLSMQDPHEAPDIYLKYLLDTYNISSIIPIDSTNYNLDRFYIENLPDLLKRKGTYNSLEIMYKIIINSSNLFNIYEQWHDRIEEIPSSITTNTNELSGNVYYMSGFEGEDGSTVWEYNNPLLPNLVIENLGQVNEISYDDKKFGNSSMVLSSNEPNSSSYHVYNFRTNSVSGDLTISQWVKIKDLQHWNEDHPFYITEIFNLKKSTFLSTDPFFVVSFLSTGDGDPTHCIRSFNDYNNENYTEDEIDMPFNDEKWHHIAFVINGTNFAWYVDGEQKEQWNSSELNVSGTYFDVFGFSTYDMVSSPFYIDDLCILNYAKWTTNFDVPIKPWTMDENISIKDYCIDTGNTWEEHRYIEYYGSAVTSAGVGDRYYIDESYPTSDTGLILSPHYRTEIDLSTEPLDKLSIAPPSILTILKNKFEEIRPVARFAEYSEVIKLPSNFKGIYNDPTINTYSGKNVYAYAKTRCLSPIYNMEGMYFYHNNYMGIGKTKIVHSLNSKDIIVQCYSVGVNEVFERFYPISIEMTDNNYIMVDTTFTELTEVYIFISKVLNNTSDLVSYVLPSPYSDEIEFADTETSDISCIVSVQDEDRTEIIPTNHIINIPPTPHRLELSSFDGVYEISLDSVDYCAVHAANNLIINHLLGTKGLLIDVYLYEDGHYKKIIPENIIIIDDDSICIGVGDTSSSIQYLVSIRRVSKSNNLYTKEMLFERINVLKIGDGSSTIGYVPVNNNLQSEINYNKYTISADGLEKILPDSNFSTFNIKVEIKAEEDINITEIGLYDNGGDMLFYTTCSNISVLKGMILILYYNIEGVVNQ